MSVRCWSSAVRCPASCGRDTAGALGVAVSGRRYTSIGLRVGLPALIAASAVVVLL